MSTTTTHMSNASGDNLGSNFSGMLNFLIDPKAAAPKLFTHWFWVGPILLFTLVSLAGNLIVTPVVEHVLLTQPVPAGANPEAFAAQVATGMKVQRALSVLFPILSIAFQALVLWGMASVVAVEAKYRQMLNLAAGCSLIQVLTAIASVIVLKSKADISTMAELRPALGLDIFLPDGANKMLAAFLGYFSVFEVWWIVMVVLILSAAYRMSKGKALTIVAPLILVSLVFRIAMAALQRN